VLNNLVFTLLINLVKLRKKIKLVWFPCRKFSSLYKDIWSNWGHTNMHVWMCVNVYMYLFVYDFNRNTKRFILGSQHELYWERNKKKKKHLFNKKSRKIEKYFFSLLC
jgi:hypothetical protein